MSWTLLLSEYPKSILDQELPSFILAWMERTGLTTEEDMAKELGIDYHVLTHALLDIYKNDL